MPTSDILKTIRTFDALLFTLAIILIIVIHPSIGKNELGQFDIFCIVPCILLGWVCFRFPPQFGDVKNWEKTTFYLRVFAMSFAFLSPFIVWWLAVPNYTYFFVSALLGIFCGISFLFYLSALIMELFNFSGINCNQFILKMMVLIVFSAFIVSLAIDYYIASIRGWDGTYSILIQLSGWIKFLFAVPFIICLDLILQIRIMLTSKYFTS